MIDWLLSDLLIDCINLYELKPREARKKSKTYSTEIGRAGVGAKPLVSIALGAIFKIEMDLLE